MLKKAYNLGVWEAYKQAELSPEQMAAAQQLGAVGGGVAGAGLGGLGGRWLGGQAAEAFDLDEPTSKTVGAGLGALLGGGIGGYAGHQAPQLAGQTPAPEQAPEQAAGGGDYSGLGLNDLYLDPYLGMNNYGYGY
jgi:hypothetical protein